MGKMLTWSRMYLLVSCFVWYTLGRWDTFNHLHVLWDVLLFMMVVGIHCLLIVVHDFLQWQEAEESWIEVERLRRERLGGVEVLPWEESSHVQAQAGEEAGSGAT